MIRQHDAARADTNRSRLSRYVADQNRRRGAGDSRHVVMLGYPETREPPPFRMLCQIDCVLERFGNSASLPHGGKIEDGKAWRVRGGHRLLDVSTQKRGAGSMPVCPGI